MTTSKHHLLRLLIYSFFCYREINKPPTMSLESGILWNVLFCDNLLKLLDADFG